MRFERLEQNIQDVIKEEQIKLGYQKETIRLYYPLSSLNHLLKTDCDEGGMAEVLKEFGEYTDSRFGELKVTHQAGRFCLVLAPEASEYVHEHTAGSGFLYEFIGLMSRHGVSIEEVTDLFRKYSEGVHVEKITSDEFDYLIYFADGTPDDYRYCFKDEGGHMIYHRFMPEDYEEYDFSD